MELKETILFWENQLNKADDVNHKIQILKTLSEQCKELGLYNKALQYIKLSVAIKEVSESENVPKTSQQSGLLFSSFQTYAKSKIDYIGLDLLCNSLKEHIFLIEKSGNLLYANSNFLNFNHISQEHLADVKLETILENFQTTFSDIQVHFQSHSSWRGKLLHKRKKDDFRWCELTVIPFQKATDSNEAYLCIESFETEQKLPEQFPFMLSCFENPFETGILLVDNHNRIIFANSYAQAMTKISKKEDYEKAFAFLFVPDSITECENQSEHKTYFLARNSQHDFSAFVCSEQINSHPDFQRIVVFEDVRLFTSQNIPLTIIKKLSRMQSLGITITGIDGKINYVNTVEAKMHLYKPQEIIGNDIGIFATTRKPLKVENIKHLKGIIRESSNYKKDGSLFPIRLLSDVITDQHGHPQAVITCSEDNSRKKLMQEEVIRFAAHLKSENDAIFCESLDGIIISWNTRAEEIFGYKTEEIKGKSSSVLQAEKSDKERFTLQEIIKKEGFVEAYETGRIKKDGSVIYVSLTISPIHNTIHQIIGYSTIAKDISEKYRYMQKIKHLNTVLRALREIDLLIHHEKESGTLLDKIASLLVQYRGYRDIWIYHKQDSNRISLTFNSIESNSRNQILESIPEKIQQILKHDEPVMIAQPETVKMPFTQPEKPLLIMPLNQNDKNYGVICASLMSELADEKEEKEIFTNIAHDVSFALYNIELENQRKEMEIALYQSELKFRKLFENSNDAIFLQNKKGFILEANETAADMIGLPQNQLTNFNLWQLFSEECQSDISTFISNFDKRDYFEYETSFERVDGMVIEVLLSVKRIDNKTNMLQTMLRDITNEKWAEEALESNLTLLQTLLETIPNPIFYKDANGVYLGCNSAYCDYMGKPKEEIIGRTAHQLVSKKQAEIFRKAEIQTMEKGQRINEARISFPDGSIHHVITTLNRFRWQNLQIGGIVGVMLDITKRKEMEVALKESEQRLQLLNRELEFVNQELKDFAYIVSHDLKAPLRGIHSLATWITADYSEVLDDDGKEQLQLLTDRVNRMHELIEGILQYSRVGNMQEEMTDIDLSQLIPEVIDLLSPPSRFSITIEPDLPVIKAEKTRIKQLFQNLISNGIKYNDKENGEIFIGYTLQPKEWEFYVRDNGPGIEKKHFATIFKMFQTINPRDDIESTGIGLTIVKRIIDLYGGSIRVESQLKQGTTFFFTIPFKLSPRK